MGRIAVAGAGASGLMAGITAAGSGVEDVWIIESQEQTGKKLRATGNGRCNFTNLFQKPSCYRCQDPSFPWTVVKKFDEKETLSFFLKMGIYPKDRDGYVYPRSDEAFAVASALRAEAERLKVKIFTGQKVCEISRRKDGFLLETDKTTIFADRVILACGSKAFPRSGSDGSGYELAKSLGHRIVPVLPALTKLVCPEKFFYSLGGIRVFGKVSLFVGGRCVSWDTGEIQLTTSGISGIPAFQVSRYASLALNQKKNVFAVLNFMPDFTEKQFLEFLTERKNTRPSRPMREFLTGLLPSKLSNVLLQIAKIDPQKNASECAAKELERLRLRIQNFSTCVTAVGSFEEAQVCTGGVDTAEVDRETLESTLVSGLYFAGEILDVDGVCGGYNLQWAWSSGHLAGQAAARSL